MAWQETWPWAVRVETLGDEADGFIVRTIVGTNLGGGVEVASVTTGSYTDEQEARHAAMLAAAPTLLLNALGLAGTMHALILFLERIGQSEAAAIARRRHDEAITELVALELVTREQLQETRDRMKAEVEAIHAAKH